MGLIDWITRKIRTPKRGNVEQVYVDSTIRSSEQTVYSAQNPDAAFAVSQCFGMVQVATQRVARDVASVPLRLYKPAGDSAGPGKVAGVGRATKRYLASGAAGRKAATYRSDDELEMVTEHPVLDFLANPNAYMSGIEFRQVQAAFKLLTGSAYALHDADRLGIHPLYPQYTRVVGGKDKVVGGYVYGRSDKEAVYLEPDRVWWSRFMPSPFSPLEGMAPLRAVLTEQQVYAAASQMELALFDNGGRPDFIVTVEGNAGPEQVEAVKNKFEARHRGSGKVGRGAYVGNSKVSVQPIGWAPKDLGNIETQRHMTTMILAALGVPESEVFLNDANLASSTTGNKQYLRQTVMPMAVQDGEDYTRWVVEDMFGLEGWCLAPENMVGTDYAQETIVLGSQLSSGIVSINEARLSLGYEPVEDEQADKLRINGTALGEQPVGLSPFGLSGETDGTKSAGPNPSDVPPERDDDGGAVSASPDDVEPTSVQPGDTNAGGCCGDGCDCGKGTVELDGKATMMASHAWYAAGAEWAKTVKPTDQSPFREDDTATIRLYRKVRSALEGMRDEIIRASDAKPFGLDQRSARAVKADTTEEFIRRVLAAWGVSDREAAFAEQVAGDTEAETRDLFDAGVEAGLGQVAEITELPVLDNSRAVAFFEGYKSDYVRGLASVNETVADQVEAVLRESVREGEGLRTIQGRIMEVFDGETADGQTMTEWRAAMVARTETARAAVEGRRGGYAAAGVRGYKFHLAPNACEFCEGAARDFADKVVPIDEPLYRKGDTLTGADGGSMTLDFADTIVPIHPHCRCDIVPVI